MNAPTTLQLTPAEKLTEGARCIEDARVKLLEAAKYFDHTYPGLHRETHLRAVEVGELEGIVQALAGEGVV